MTIAVLDYGSSNLFSVVNALKRLGRESEVVTDPGRLAGCDRVILPGVGAAGSAMEALKAAGWDRAIPKLTVPVLGICLGLQVLAKSSEEDATGCLGIFPGRVRKFPPDRKVPHLGWNRVAKSRNSPLWEGIPSGEWFYFVNGYFYEGPEEDVTGLTPYGEPFAAMISRGNFFGVQFHPEKSGPAGERLLKNFCERC